MFRRRRSQRSEGTAQSQPAVELAGLRPEWRTPVEDAVAARRRFQELVARVRPGPLRQRLEGMAAQLDDAVLRCWETATRAQAAEEMVASLDPERATRELKEARRRLELVGDHERADREALEASVEMLSARHGAVHRAMNGVDDARRRLRLLDVRLQAAVAQALELVLTPAGDAAVDRVDSELRNVVGELAALRSAMEEVGG